jgi:hypothetical protein
MSFELRSFITKIIKESVEPVLDNLNDNFKNWFGSSKVSSGGVPIVVYHGTSKKFSKFNIKKSVQPIIWFTSNKSAIEAGEVGAAGSGHIMELYASIQNPAGWAEYEKYGLGQLKGLGYDGAILKSGDGHFDGFVFESSQLKSVKNKGEWDPSNKNIYKENNSKNEESKPYKFYMLCDKLCNTQGVEVKNKMVADAKPISKKEFVSNCAYATQMMSYEGDMLDDPSHGFYISNVNGVPCMYMQYAGFEFIFLKDAPGGQEYWLDDPGFEPIEESSDMTDYNKWKRKNVVYRGISSDSTLDVANGSGARFGRGLYMVPLSNKAMAKGYGTVYYVVNGKPKNPMVFKDANLAEIWIQQNLIYNKYKDAREFEANTSIEKEMLKLGYDGIEIKGREIVNFTPENVKYYLNDNQLIQHYEHYIENKDTLKEFIAKTLSESLIGEEYPKHFDMNYFKALKTFKQRIQYCQDNLKRLAAGSSRIVYQIDDEKVLKLAKNGKGIAQNDTEIDRGSGSYFSDILAQVYDYDADGLWVEMELARKINAGEFRMRTGFDLNDVAKYLINFQDENNGKKARHFLQQPLVDRLDNDEFIQKLREFVAGTDALAGDLGQISSYGAVKRDGQEEIVLVDFGITEAIYSTHYAKSLREMKEVNGEWIYSGRDVNRHIKSITPDPSDLPHFFMKIIAKRNFKIQKISLIDLLNTDADFKEYYEAFKKDGEGRYDADIENGEGPHEDDLFNEPVVVDGELLDGYNRCSVRLRNGETEVEAFVALPKKEPKKIEEGWKENLAVALSLFTSVALGQSKPQVDTAKQSTEQATNQSFQVHSAILGYLDLYSRDMVDAAKDKFQMATAIKEVRVYCENMRDGKPVNKLSLPAKALFKTVSEQLKKVNNIDYYVNQGKGIHR